MFLLSFSLLAIIARWLVYWSDQQQFTYNEASCVYLFCSGGDCSMKFKSLMSEISKSPMLWEKFYTIRNEWVDLSLQLNRNISNSPDKEWRGVYCLLWGLQRTTLREKSSGKVVPVWLMYMYKGHLIILKILLEAAAAAATYYRKEPHDDCVNCIGSSPLPSSFHDLIFHCDILT